MTKVQNYMNREIVHLEELNHEPNNNVTKTMNLKQEREYNDEINKLGIKRI